MLEDLDPWTHHNPLSQRDDFSPRRWAVSTMAFSRQQREANRAPSAAMLEIWGAGVHDGPAEQRARGLNIDAEDFVPREKKFDPWDSPMSQGPAVPARFSAFSGGWAPPMEHRGIDPWESPTSYDTWYGHQGFGAENQENDAWEAAAHGASDDGHQGFDAGYQPVCADISAARDVSDWVHEFDVPPPPPGPPPEDEFVPVGPPKTLACFASPRSRRENQPDMSLDASRAVTEPQECGRFAEDIAAPGAPMSQGVTAERLAAALLIRASAGGHFEVCKQLLVRGAALDGRDSDGATALHRAAEGGHTKVCALLLDSGMRINKKDANGDTALQRAAAGGHVETCALLRDRDIAMREAKAARKARDKEQATDSATTASESSLRQLS